LTLLQESDGAVQGPGCEASAIGREGHGTHRISVALQLEEVGDLGWIPELDGAVPGPGCEASAIRREVHGLHLANVALQHEEVGALGWIPELEGAVPGPGYKVSTIRREGHSFHQVIVALQCLCVLNLLICLLSLGEGFCIMISGVHSLVQVHKMEAY
jgi:hypothetical protein